MGGDVSQQICGNLLLIVIELYSYDTPGTVIAVRKHTRIIIHGPCFQGEALNGSVIHLCTDKR